MIKRILSLLLAVSLMGGAVVSCGGQNKPELSRVTNVYQSTDVTLPDNISVSAMYMTEEGLLIRATEVLDEGPYENRAQAEAARREVLLDFDIDTGDYTVEPLPKMKSGSYLNFVLPQIYHILSKDIHYLFRQYSNQLHPLKLYLVTRMQSFLLSA